MGGLGSGRSHYDKKTTVQECTSVWIGQVKSWAREHGTTLEEIKAAGGFPLTVTWRPNSQQYQFILSLTTGPCGRYGQRRYYLVCPVCRGRAMVLYLPHRAAEGQPFACRRCWRLTYATQQEQESRLLKAIVYEVAVEQGHDPALLDHRRVLQNAWREEEESTRRQENIFDQPMAKKAR